MTGSYGKGMFDFLRHWHTVFKVVLSFYIPITSIGEFQMTQILVNTYYGQFFYFSHSNGLVVVSTCGFNLHFSDE